MIIQCKMCGGDIDFIPGATCGACAYCGSVSTIPRAEDETKLNRYNRANHFRRQCEFDKALTAREKLLEQDDTDAEAHWGAVISRYGIEYVEDPATGRRVPTCHRVQVASILADTDYQAAVEHAPTPPAATCTGSRRRISPKSRRASWPSPPARSPTTCSSATRRRTRTASAPARKPRRSIRHTGR